MEGGYATIEGCQIRDNVAYDAGGGLTVIRNPSPLVHNGTIIVRDCDFLDNAAGEYGGGACVGSGSTSGSPGNASISGCVFAGNKSGQYGGGIAVTAGSLTIADSSVAGNSAGSLGGGVFAWSSPYGGASKLTMQGVAVIGNTAVQGGGIFNSGDLAATGIMLLSNSAATGGGIDNSAGGTATITGSAIIANVASGAGGGLYNDGTAGARVLHCLGQLGGHGGGIYAAEGGRVTLAGTLVIGNKKDNIAGSSRSPEASSQPVSFRRDPT